MGCGILTLYLRIPLPAWPKLRGYQAALGGPASSLSGNFSVDPREAPNVCTVANCCGPPAVPACNIRIP